MSEKEKLAFGKKNYRFMLIGLAIVAMGFVFMCIDKQPYGFGFFGITLGPIMVIGGFIVEFIAILSRPKKSK